MKKSYLLVALLMLAATVQATLYGIMINGTDYHAGELNPTPLDPSFQEYQVLNVSVPANATLQLWDQDNNAGWAVDLDPASVQGISRDGDHYVCSAEGCYDFYIKLKYENDQLYIGACQGGGDKPDPTGDVYYIKLPVAENDWVWNEMDEEEDGTWTFTTTWVGGGANINTEMIDNERSKYISDEEMDFGENLVAPEAGEACTFIWHPSTKILSVKYEKSEGFEIIEFELDLNAPMFDMTGRPVSDDFHGIIIQKGHKYIR